MTHYFKATIGKVEEKFEKQYKSESVCDAKVESQMEYEMISCGWFVTLAGWGVAIRIGDKQPKDLAAGDTVLLAMSKLPLVSL